MAIAFGGLLFSNSAAINQLAFFLVFAVLFDTFVVRSVVVPVSSKFSSFFSFLDLSNQSTIVLLLFFFSLIPSLQCHILAN
jgi:hypothetical protein